jgi:hypothetical protein
MHAPTGTDFQVPEEGDASVCWGCQKVGIFTADGSVREATPEEDANLQASPEIQNVLLAMKKSSLGPTALAELMRHVEEWETGKLK